MQYLYPPACGVSNVDCAGVEWGIISTDYGEKGERERGERERAAGSILISAKSNSVVVHEGVSTDSHLPFLCNIFYMGNQVLTEEGISVYP